MFGKRQGMGMACRGGAGIQSGYGGGNRNGRRPGMGRGLGSGRGIGQGYGMMSGRLETPEQEIEVLTRAASCLKQDLDQVTSRIEALKQQGKAPEAQ